MEWPKKYTTTTITIYIQQPTNNKYNFIEDHHWKWRSSIQTCNRCIDSKLRLIESFICFHKKPNSSWLEIKIMKRTCINICWFERAKGNIFTGTGYFSRFIECPWIKIKFVITNLIEVFWDRNTIYISPVFLMDSWNAQNEMHFVTQKGFEQWFAFEKTIISNIHYFFIPRRIKCKYNSI